MDFKIAPSVSADTTIKLAQSELENFCSQSGVKNLSVEFQLSEAQGYSLINENGILQFFASTSVEILYAVYDFAETHLGYCFFEPGVNLRTDVNGQIPEGMLFDRKQPKLKRPRLYSGVSV